MSSPVPDPSAPPRWVRTTASIAALVVVIATGVAGLGYGYKLYLDSRIDIAPDQPAYARPDKVVPSATASPTADEPVYEPMNILVMGSDTREGQGSKYGSASEITGARADTAMIVHLSADRKRALVVSIPRDTWVDLPECTDADGNTWSAEEGKFNAAFERGGPSCTVKTLEEMTDVRIDHFMVVNFTGFKEIIDAIKGVEVCVTEAVDDQKSGLQLPAGTSTVKGEQALAFVRARKTLGDGSDLDRIKRQQQFMSSLIRKVTDLGTFTDPRTAFSVLNSATSNLTTDKGLGSLDKLTELAESAYGLKPNQVSFVTVPWVAKGDGENVVISENADALWTALKEDTVWPAPVVTKGSDGKPLVTAPESVTVNVLNGTTTKGLARKAADALKAAGFQINEVAGAPTTGYTQTTLTYDPTRDESARTLDAAAKGTVMVAEEGAGSVLTLVVGSDYDGITRVKVPDTSGSSGGDSTSNPTAHGADEVTCAS